MTISEVGDFLPTVARMGITVVAATAFASGECCFAVLKWANDALNFKFCALSNSFLFSVVEEAPVCYWICSCWLFVGLAPAAVD